MYYISLREQGPLVSGHVLIWCCLHLSLFLLRWHEEQWIDNCGKGLWVWRREPPTSCVYMWFWHALPQLSTRGPSARPIDPASCPMMLRSEGVGRHGHSVCSGLKISFPYDVSVNHLDWLLTKYSQALQVRSRLTNKPLHDVKEGRPSLTLSSWWQKIFSI